jgi:hypothetical protein
MLTLWSEFPLPMHLSENRRANPSASEGQRGTEEPSSTTNTSRRGFWLSRQEATASSSHLGLSYAGMTMEQSQRLIFCSSRRRNHHKQAGWLTAGKRPWRNFNLRETQLGKRRQERCICEHLAESHNKLFVFLLCRYVFTPATLRVGLHLG